MDNNPPQSSNLHQQAIEAALDSRWAEALKINKKIIKENPEDIDALNCLARAYMETGKTNLAKKYYSEALKIDPYNPIAQKNLKIMKSFKSKNQTPPMSSSTRLSPFLFLQEPGKTKIVNLLKVAEPQKLSQTYCGMKVEMTTKNRRITIIDVNGNYLGVLPDDISHHLSKLSKGGNKYELFVKAISVNSLSIIIKEVFRSKRFKNQPSFLEHSGSNTATDMITSINNNSSEEESTEENEDQEI